MTRPWTERARGAGKSAPRSRSPRSASRSPRSLGPRGRACPTPGRVGDARSLTPLLLFALATAAVVFDVQALRRGDRVWARIGLAAVSLAAVLGIWAAAAGFFRPGCG